MMPSWSRGIFGAQVELNVEGAVGGREQSAVDGQVVEAPVFGGLRRKDARRCAAIGRSPIARDGELLFPDVVAEGEAGDGAGVGRKRRWGLRKC